MRARSKAKRHVQVKALPRSVGAYKAPVALAGSSALPESFLEATIEFWQPNTRRNLTREDAREIVENMIGFFSVLRQWREAERVAARNKGGLPAPIERSAIASTKRNGSAAVKLRLP